MPQEPLLEIRKLSIQFNEQLALNQVNLQVLKGQIHALVGESGSGKTLTAMSIPKLVPSPPAEYVSGEILLHEGNTSTDLLKLDNDSVRSFRANKISVVFQEPMTSLNPLMRCGQQILERFNHLPITYNEKKKRVLELLEQVNLPNPIRAFNAFPHQLSGGQKQRIMIAMAISAKPSLLICDEPTTALDVTVQKEVLFLLKKIQQEEGMGILFITHDLGVVAEIADYVTVLYKGKVVEEGPCKVILQQPVHPYTQALLQCRPAMHEKGERLPVVADYLEEKKIVEEIIPFKTCNNDELLLEVKNISVRYSSKKNWLGKTEQWFDSVKNVSFEIKKGETVGLVGESGCGKSTLGRAILRLIEPSSGEVFFNQRNISTASLHDLKNIRPQLQIIFQDPYSALSPSQRIGDALLEPIIVHQPNLPKEHSKKKVMDMLERVGLDAAAFNRYPHEFSGGQRQRIVIARALMLEPKLVVCDESVSALDVSVQAQVLNLLNDLKATMGFSALFISHDLSVIRYISDRILVMQQGEIVERGTAEQVYNHPQHPYTKKLLDSMPRLENAFV
ncbi:MAG: ABC transporter ATP-binding protein [Hydrotalea sp.]|nr:ABC transporter ATP-binding protein [Hydrotalea sp.]